MHLTSTFLRFQLKPVKKNDPNNPSKKIEVLGEDGGVKRDEFSIVFQDEM